MKQPYLETILELAKEKFEVATSEIYPAFRASLNPVNERRNILESFLSPKSFFILLICFFNFCFMKLILDLFPFSSPQIPKGEINQQIKKAKCMEFKDRSKSSRIFYFFGSLISIEHSSVLNISHMNIILNVCKKDSFFA